MEVNTNINTHKHFPDRGQAQFPGILYLILILETSLWKANAFFFLLMGTRVYSTQKSVLQTKSIYYSN